MDDVVKDETIQEDKLVSFVDEQLKKGDKKTYEMQWYLNIAYFVGKQWIAFDSVNKRLYEPEREPWQVRFVGNRIQPIVRTELAKITKNKPTIVVTPASNEDSDIKSARVAEKVADYLFYELDLKAKNQELGLWGLTCAGFIKPFWNNNKGNDAGQGLKQGDVDADIVSPFEIDIDPSAKKWSEVKWVCHKKVRDTDYVKQVYDKEVEAEGGILESNLYESQLKDITIMGQGITYKNAENAVIVKEYWEKPTAKYPKGRRITIANGVLLFYEEDIGFGDEDDTERELPFFPFFHINVPGRVWPTTINEQLIPIQREYNKTRSQIIENKNLMANPIWLVPKGSTEEEISAGMPGQIIEYKPQIGKPEMAQAPSMSADVYKNEERCIEEFEFISGQHETSHGSTPTGVKSGVAIAYLQEQDDTKLGPTISNFESCIQNYMKYMLKMVKFKYIEERLIKIVGQDNKIETFYFKGSDLTSTDVRIVSGSSLPQSKAAKQEWIMNLVTNRVLDPVKDRELIMKMLELGITEDMYDYYTIDINQAEAEKEQWLKGDFSPDVRDFYNHEIHITEHNKFRKSDDYKQLDPQAKALIDAHVKAHEDYILQRIIGQGVSA